MYSVQSICMKKIRKSITKEVERNVCKYLRSKISTNMEVIHLVTDESEPAAFPNDAKAPLGWVVEDDPPPNGD